jgi:hypothetical protein
MKSILKMFEKNKKGQIVSGLVAGIAGLVILVIVSFLIVDTLNGAGLLTSGGASANATSRMIANYTAGIDNVSGKLPTILLVAAVVLLFGAIVLLVQRARQTTGATGGSL